MLLREETWKLNTDRTSRDGIKVNVALSIIDISLASCLAGTYTDLIFISSRKRF